MNTFDNKLFEVVKRVEEIKQQVDNGLSSENDIVLPPPLTVKMLGDHAQYYDVSYDNTTKEVIIDVSQKGWQMLGSQQITAAVVFMPNLPSEAPFIYVKYDSKTKTFKESTDEPIDITPYKKYYEYNLNGTGSDRYFRTHYPFDPSTISKENAFTTREIAYLIAIGSDDTHMFGSPEILHEFQFSRDVEDSSSNEDSNKAVSLGYLQYYAANKTHTSSDITDAITIYYPDETAMDEKLITGKAVKEYTKSQFADKGHTHELVKEYINNLPMVESSNRFFEFDTGSGNVTFTMKTVPNGEWSVKFDVYCENNSLVGENSYTEHNVSIKSSESYSNSNEDFGFSIVGGQGCAEGIKISLPTSECYFEVVVNETTGFEKNYNSDNTSREYYRNRTPLDERIFSGRAIKNFIKANVPNLVYPVGSIYWTVADTNPQTTLGFGTWEKVTGLTETTIFAYKRTA